MHRVHPIYIFDLDGTLANCEHRVSHIPNWDKFHSMCHLDTPIEPTIRLAKALSLTGDVWIVTGRSEDYRKATNKWLVDNGLWGVDLIFMRKHGDHRPDFEIKGEWYSSLALSAKKRVKCVFEDRQRVVDMWRHKGITCYQVNYGDF